MKSFFGALLIVAMVLGGFNKANADEKSHRAAAEAVLTAMDMEKTMELSINTMLDAQMKAAPQLAAKKSVMKEFFNKFMSFAALKDDMVTIYAEAFTEDELKDLKKFYDSPIGKKMIEKTPEILSKSASLGTERVQKNQAELIKMLQK